MPDINNELEVKNEEYKERLKSLNKFVMFMFMNDVTVKPKETAVSFFGFFSLRVSFAIDVLSSFTHHTTRRVHTLVHQNSGSGSKTRTEM